MRRLIPVVRRHAPLALVLIGTLVVQACADDSVTTPSTVSSMPAGSVSHQRHAGSALTSAVNSVTSFVGRFIGTSLGQQPNITPSLRLESLKPGTKFRPNTPVTIRVAYQNFDFRPELRTPDAARTLGSQPQTVTNGMVQGHIHGYLQRLPEDGSLPSIESNSFCVLERAPERSGFNGIAEGECPGVPEGEYRLSVEFQTNSHTAILKTGPRSTPTADVTIIRVK